MGIGARPTDGLDDFFERQVRRIHRNTKRALDDSRRRRYRLLADTYGEMDADRRVSRTTEKTKRR